MIVAQTKIFCEILDERNRQDEKWGGPEHDDTHTVAHWREFILDTLNRQYIGQLDYRECMVRVAALAVAAIESYDRLEHKCDHRYTTDPEGSCRASCCRCGELKYGK